MTDELVAYLLDDLCPERRADVERRLANDAEWQREFQRLKDCFAVTGDPSKCVDEPPRDLVTRTCQCVERSDERRRSPAVAAFVAEPLAADGRASWSFADMAVAGGVLALLGMLITPALRESRDASRRLACQDNLRALGTGLFDFQANHGQWLPAMAPDAPAGMFAAALANDAGFDRAELAHRVVCPESQLADQIASGEATIEIPNYEELARLVGPRRAQFLRSLGDFYAYRVGYYDPHGVYHPMKFTGAMGDPLLTDAPSVSSAGVRSTNHDGCGQNVLDQRLSVKYRANCELAESLDPIYLNMRGEHAAGCNKDDVVVMRGDRSPAWAEPADFWSGAVELHLIGDFGDGGE